VEDRENPGDHSFGGNGRSVVLAFLPSQVDRPRRPLHRFYSLGDRPRARRVDLDQERSTDRRFLVEESE